MSAHDAHPHDSFDDAADLEDVARLASDLDRDVAFREAVARAIGGSRAPLAVRDRLTAAAREQFAENRRRESMRLSPERVSEGVLGRAAGGRASGGARAGRGAPTRPNAFAVAASLLLVSGAILFGIFGPRIGMTVPASGATSVAEVAAVVVSEHEQCTMHESCGMQSAPWRSPTEAGRELSRLLGREVSIPDLDRAGFSFCRGGQTTIPGAGGRSGHLLYCRTVGDACSWLSVFVAPVETRFLASDALGRTGPLDCTIHYYEFLAPGSGEIFYFCDGVVTWFVKPSDPTDFEIVRHFFPDSFRSP